MLGTIEHRFSLRMTVIKHDQTLISVRIEGKNENFVFIKHTFQMCGFPLMTVASWYTFMVT